MSFEHGPHRETPLTHSSSASSSLNGTSRTASPSTPTARPSDTQSSSSHAANHRPRHHARSFSSESRSSPSTNDASSSSLSSTSSVRSRASTHTDTSISPSIVINPSSPPLNVVSPPAIFHSLPVRARKTPSPPLPDVNQKESSPPRTQSPASPRGNGSPTKRSTSLQDIQEQERLNQLKEQQANRRPKMMRLTPAYSSTPVRLQSPLSKGTTKKESSVMVKSSSQGSETNVVHFPAKNGQESELEPGVGLQIDLGCIPSPSLDDLKGPISTSHLDGLIRDRNGNPIKPSLKSPRSSVSYFLPGRTVRSDSTPALPSNLLSKSVPTTPTVAKAVHFDSQLEHVKVFKFKQRPTAVSRDGSPEQTETETEEEKDQFPYIWKKNGSQSPTSASFFSNMTQPASSTTNRSPATLPLPEVEEQLVLRLPNFPSSTRVSVDREIFLERIFLAEDLRSVKGTVQVRNMSFEKWVAIRYTLDHWATIGEVSAEYSETIKGGQADRFTFSIKLNELLNWPRGSAAHETKSMFMCLRYTVNNAEFWDNNEGLNYQLDFRKRQVPTTPLSTPTAATVLAQPRAMVAPSVGQNAAVRSKVFDLARKGGVGGRGVFAMEDLKRELDKLRSDEEDEEEGLAIHRTLASELAKKKASPPSSPGGARSSSPSIWTARYDFGQSLRNPRSGSRSSGLGRAAALDYFSAKPMTRTGSNSRTSSVEVVNREQIPETTPSNTILSQKQDQMAQIAKSSPDFSHKFGMVSPGLGGGPVEHKPLISDSTTASVEGSPLPTLVPNDTDSSPITPSALGSDRFYSYPPHRYNGSTTPTLSNSGRISPSFFTPVEELGADMMAESASQDVQALDRIAMHLSPEKDGDSSVISEYYSPAESPLSDAGSPNPFSPTDSISSAGSDTTVSNLASPVDRQSRTKMVMQPGHARRSNNSSMASSISSVSLDNIMSGASMLAPSVPSHDDSSAADKLRPASMSDYQELVNKYCWNSDLVPSGGSTIPDLPTNGGLNGSTTLTIGSHSPSKLSPKIRSPALSSGRSTPTLR